MRLGHAVTYFMNAIRVQCVIFSLCLSVAIEKLRLFTYMTLLGLRLVTVVRHSDTLYSLSLSVTGSVNTDQVSKSNPPILTSIKERHLA